LGSIHKELISIEGRGFTRINLRQDRLNETPIFLPPLQEQIQIVQFLDEKTELIDKLISTKERKITLLKEQRTLLINQVVTKGLNPNVKMKDSGVEWIGEIPEHWIKTPLKYISYMKGRIGWKGLKQEEFFDEGDYLLITGHDIKNDKINWNKCYHISKERYDESPEIMLQLGDLLFTKDGTIGKTLLIDNLPKPTSLNSHLLLIRPLNDFYNSKFLQYLLKSLEFLVYVEHKKTGTTFYGVSQETMENFKGYFPPLNEQNEIVNYLDSKTVEIDNLIDLEQNKIDLLNEYRQSLISEVVTGKIKVTTDE
jgi:type I restriction enzyme S subunit